MKALVLGLGERYQRLVDECSDFDIRLLIDLDTLEDWPASVRACVVAGAFGCGVVAASWLWLAPEAAQLLGARAQQAALRADYGEKSRSLEKLPALRKEGEEQDRSLGGLLHYLPSKAEIPRLIDELTATGLGSGVAFRRIQLEQEVAQQGYKSLPIDIEMSGGYHDFATFVSGVGQLERLITVHDFEITQRDDKGLRMQMTAQTYHDEAGDEAGGEARDERKSRGLSSGAIAAAGALRYPVVEAVRYASAGLRSPFEAAGARASNRGPSSLIAPDTRRARGPMESFLLDELQMVGFFATRDGLLALIETPEAELHRIRVGDYLGADHGRVWRVRRTGVDLIEIVPSGAGSWVERPQVVVLRDTEPSLARGAAL